MWASIRHVDVLLLMGSNIINVRGLFGMEGVPNPDRPIHRIAAVNTKNGVWYSVEGRSNEVTVNHYVIGILCDGVVSALRRPTVGKAMAIRAAMSVGWTLKATNTTGDCGIDAMAHHSGAVRNRAVFQNIRDELSAALLERCEQPAWQDAFVACREHDPSAGPAGPADAAAGGMGPPPARRQGLRALRLLDRLPLQGLRLRRFHPPPLPSDADARPSGLPPPLSPQDAGPPPLPPLPPPAQRPQLPQGADAEPSGSSELVPVETFKGWLNSLPSDHLAIITKGYWTFREVEEGWLAARPVVRRARAIRRSHRRTSLNHRLATGIAYRRWLEGDGRQPKSKLKDSRAKPPFTHPFF